MSVKTIGRRPFATTLVSFIGAGLLTGCRDRNDGPAPATTARRILSQTVLSDEILWHFGDDVRRRVVGVSHMADDPRYSGVAGRWPRSVPRVRGTSEALVSARPDLVVLAEFTAIETRTLLEQSGIRTLTLEGFDGFADYRNHVRSVADAVGSEGAGASLLRRFGDELARIRTPASSEPASVVSWTEGNVAGARTVFDDEAEAAGLTNAAAHQGVRGHRRVPIERLLTWDPDLIVTACNGDCEASRRHLLDLPGLMATTAARTNGILAIESRFLYSTGLGMLEVVRILARRSAEMR